MRILFLIFSYFLQIHSHHLFQASCCFLPCLSGLFACRLPFWLLLAKPCHFRFLNLSFPSLSFFSVFSPALLFSPKSWLLFKRAAVLAAQFLQGPGFAAAIAPYSFLRLPSGAGTLPGRFLKTPSGNIGPAAFCLPHLLQAIHPESCRQPGCRQGFCPLEMHVCRLADFAKKVGNDIYSGPSSQNRTKTAFFGAIFPHFPAKTVSLTNLLLYLKQNQVSFNLVRFCLSQNLSGI